MDVHWTEIALFASPFAHTIMIPFHPHTTANLVLILGQVVSLFALGYLVRYSDDAWQQTITAAIATAFVLPHFFLNHESVGQLTGFLRLPKTKPWTYPLLAFLVCSILFGTYWLLMDMSTAVL